MRRRPHDAPTSPAPPSGRYSTLMCALPSPSPALSLAPSLRRATLALYPSCPKRGGTSKNRARRLAVACGLWLPAAVWTDACLCRRPRRRRCLPAPAGAGPVSLYPVVALPSHRAAQGDIVGEVTRPAAYAPRDPMEARSDTETWGAIGAYSALSNPFPTSPTISQGAGKISRLTFPAHARFRDRASTRAMPGRGRWSRAAPAPRPRRRAPPRTGRTRRP